MTKIKKSVSIFIIALLFLNWMSPLATAFATTGHPINATIQSATIEGSKETYYNGDQIGIHLDWSITQGTTVKAGDYFTIDYPDFLKVASQTLQMNHGTCEPAGNVMTCTFDERVNDLDKLYGGFEFGAQLQLEQNSGKHQKEITLNGQLITTINVDGGDDSQTGINPGGNTGRDLGKWGKRSMDDPSIINWIVELNGDKTYDVFRFIDTPGHGHEIIPGSVSIGVNGQVVSLDSQHVDAISVTSQKIDVQLRSYRLDYPQEKYGAVIQYQTKITDENVKEWSNTASLYPHGGSEQTISTAVEKFGGAWSHGELAKYTGMFVVDKTNPEGQPLAGAEFKLQSEDGTIHTLITDEHGKASLPSVSGGHYTLSETKAPEGYIRLEAPVDVTLVFNTDKEHIEKIINEKEETPENPIQPNPETPVVPEEPTQPDPETPVVPEEPTQPDPETPVVPEEPTQPDPETPVVPEEPTQPDPETPVVPEEPTQPDPETPVVPEEPTQPDPETPVVPEEPTQPEPETPVVPEEPTQPEPETPVVPEEPTQPDPETPVVPEEPIQPEPETPVVPEEPIQPEPETPVVPEEPIQPEPETPVVPEEPIQPEPETPVVPEEPIEEPKEEELGEVVIIDEEPDEESNSDSEVPVQPEELLPEIEEDELPEIVEEEELDQQLNSSNTSSELPKKGQVQKLPQTGEEHYLFSIVSGILLIFTGFLFFFRRREVDSIQ